MNQFAQALSAQNQSQSARNHTAPGMSMAQLGQAAHNQFANTYAQQYAQQWQHQQYNAGRFNQMAAERQHKFMIDGRTMTFEQFLDEVAPEPGAMRTFLTLKYQR